MNFVRHRSIFYIISSTLFVVSVVAYFTIGLRLGIDFTGGTLWEIEFTQEQPSLGDIRGLFSDAGLSAAVQNTEGKRVLIRLQDISEEQHQGLLASLGEKFAQDIVELRFDSIGPILGKELQQKAVLATVIAIVGILLYIAFAFRRMTKPVSSFKFAISAIIALMHDVVITVGVFVILGRFLNIEVGLPFVAAVLTVLGYSVNDTVVVFDRVRENAIRHGGKDFGAVVDASLRQTMGRSVITSLTVALTLLAIVLFGGSTVKYFALAILIGGVVGTYSSICIATPLLVDLGGRRRV